jgi:ubiquinone/menaquinone biosynthesis C-methylase UbiE
VRTGKPWTSKDHPDKAPFEVLAGDEADQRVFNDAMAGLSSAEGPALVQAYDFEGFRRIVDVGGGNGTLAALIAAKAPHASVAAFDLPHVIADAKARANRTGSGIEFVPGSFFEQLPGPTDLFVLKHVLHDWDDARARTILRTCRRALSDGGRVLICEMVISPGPAAVPALILDIEMLTGAGGSERTEAEFAQLLAEVDLHLNRTIHTGAGISLLEATAAH